MTSTPGRDPRQRAIHHVCLCVIPENSNWCLTELCGDESEIRSLYPLSVICVSDIFLVSEEIWNRFKYPNLISYERATSEQQTLNLIMVLHMNVSFELKWTFLCGWIDGQNLQSLYKGTRGGSRFGTEKKQGRHSLAVKQSCFPNHWKCLQMCCQILHLKCHQDLLYIYIDLKNRITNLSLVKKTLSKKITFMRSEEGPWHSKALVPRS